MTAEWGGIGDCGSALGTGVVHSSKLQQKRECVQYAALFPSHTITRKYTTPAFSAVAGKGRGRWFRTRPGHAIFDQAASVGVFIAFMKPDLGQPELGPAIFCADRDQVVMLTRAGTQLVLVAVACFDLGTAIVIKIIFTGQF